MLKQQKQRGAVQSRGQGGGYIKEQDDDDNFFGPEDDYHDKNYMDPTAVNSKGNSVNQSYLDDSVISQTIRDLAGKAYELSMKYDLRDEAKLIQQEELRLKKLLKEEDEQKNHIVNRLHEEESRLKSAFKDTNKRSRQKQVNQSKTMNQYGSGLNNKQSNSTLSNINKSNQSQKQKMAKPYESVNYTQSMQMSSVQNTQENLIFNDSLDQLNESELVLNSAVQRLHNDATRRKELKERIQLLSAKRELEELRQQPAINQKSNKLVNKNDKQYIPIHERYEKVLHETSLKKNQFTAEVLEESIQKDPDQYFPSFHPKTNEGRAHNNFDEFLEHTNKWHSDKLQKLQNNHKDKLNEVDKHCTFQPQINDLSTDIISQSDKYRTSNDFLERVEKYQEIKEIKIKHLETVLNKDVTFKPNTYSKLDVASKYYERQIKKQQLAQEQELQLKTNSQKSITQKVASSQKSSDKSITKVQSNGQNATKQYQSLNEKTNTHTPTFNLSVVESQRFGNHIEQSFRDQQDFDDYGQSQNIRQDQVKVQQNYKSDDKLTQMNTNDKGQSMFSVNEDSFAKPNEGKWIFSSDKNLSNQSDEEFQEHQNYLQNQEVSSFSVRSQKNQDKNPNQKNIIDRNLLFQNFTAQPANKKIDLQDYLAQLEIKMKQDEEELQNYERELSKHSSNTYDNY